MFNSLTFQDLEIITFISHILRTCVEKLALLKSTLNHQTPLFCCHNCGPFRNLISWSRGVESRCHFKWNNWSVFFFPPCACEQPCLSLACLVLSEMEGRKHAEGLQKALQSLLFNLTRRREVSWKRKYVSLLLYTTWELIHCLGLLTTPCQVLRQKCVPTQHLNCIWTLAGVSKCLARNQWEDTSLGGHGKALAFIPAIDECQVHFIKLL